MSGGGARGKNIIFSGIFLVISVAMGGYALTTMNMGTLDRMGPAFFPVVLSAILAALSLIVLFLPAPPETEPFVMAPPRATLIIIVCPMIFGFAIEPFGLLIAVFLSIFVSCLASQVTTLRQAALLSAAFSLFCVLVFHYLLNMTIPLWGFVFTG
ncbi:tripartite tricarboxylate transporter TctB family protein [Martelella soudanensis]|uniref:tripartite tricarboxylate transporter TctB family protein n=1 Tax=unclassified Martelella TaxID=2629616 RepID=UPI0015DE12F2|nr:MULTISPECIES: tripartite tricarboxylate transporter TctB family protein [unclassified Martelella]